MLTESTALISKSLEESADKLNLWLKHEASLMERLALFSKEVHLTILKESWRTPTWWETYDLKIDDHLVFVREVKILADANPCWYARSVFPKKTYALNELLFKGLSEGLTLGELIFGDFGIKRQKMIYFDVEPQSITHYCLSPIFQRWMFL